MTPEPCAPLKVLESTPIAVQRLAVRISTRYQLYKATGIERDDKWGVTNVQCVPEGWQQGPLHVVTEQG